MPNYKKKSADFRQRSQAHHKPNIQWVSLHLYGTNPIVYSFARFYFEVVIRERLSKLSPNVLYPSFTRIHCKYNHKFNVSPKMYDKNKSIIKMLLLPTKLGATTYKLTYNISLHPIVANAQPKAPFFLLPLNRRIGFR